MEILFFPTKVRENPVTKPLLSPLLLLLLSVYIYKNIHYTDRSWIILKEKRL
jgi:hypothetical protein